MMKKNLGILKILAILMIGLMIGAFAERNHVFGYADNTPILPVGTYKTTAGGNWDKITISRNNFTTENKAYTIIDNRYTNRTKGRLVIAQKKGGNVSKSYYVTKIKEGWKVESIINGKPDFQNPKIFYSNN